MFNRSVLQQEDLKKQHLEKTVKSLRDRCSAMEDQCVQHGHVHQRMKTRYVHGLYWYDKGSVVKSASPGPHANVLLRCSQAAFK